MNSSRFARHAFGLPFLLSGVCALALSPAVGYHLVKKIPFGAAPGGSEYFDYINFDSAARRVYLSWIALHSFGAQPDSRGAAALPLPRG